MDVIYDRIEKKKNL